MNRTILIFELDGTRFGIEARWMQESVWLPELSPIEEAPVWVAGVFSLRGQIIPVTDLGMRFGHPPRDFRTTDQVIVLQIEHSTLGLIANEVIDVLEIGEETIQPPPAFLEPSGRQRILFGEIRYGREIVSLIDATALLKEPAPPSPRVARAPHERGAQEIFRARAAALMESDATRSATHLPLAVVELEEECFGIDLATVEEFCEFSDPYPIPCCPPHILGAINLRGVLLTLIDPREALGLPPMSKKSGKAVVSGGIAMAVDDVRDVLYLPSTELRPAPVALREQHGAWVKGSAAYGGAMMAVLDLPSLLKREEWLVNESIH